MKKRFFYNSVAIFSNYFRSTDFVNSGDCIGNQKQSEHFQNFIFGPMRMNFNLKLLDLCQHYLAVFLICITKKYWTKSNFPSKCDFMFDEDENITLAGFL